MKNNAMPITCLAVQLSSVVAACIIMPGMGWGGAAALTVMGVGIVLLRLTAAMRCVLLVALSVLGVLVIANVSAFTAGGTTPALEPLLENTDAARNWGDALAWLGQPQAVHAASSHSMYGLVLAGWMWIWGVSIESALMPGVVLTMVTLYLVGSLTRVIAGQRAAVAAVAAVSCVCYLMASGAVLVKDAWVICALAMAARSLVPRINPGALAVAVLMMLLARPNALLFVVLGLLMVPRGQKVLRIASGVVCLLLVGAVQCLGVAPAVGIQLTADVRTFIAYDEPRQMAYTDIFGDYATLPWWRKVLMLPSSAATQYLIPFPWNFMRDTVYGPSQIWAHIAYGWYVFGGMFIYGLLFCRRALDNTAVRLALWGAVCWLVPCYMFGGTISRYGLPAVPLMAPCVGILLSKARAMLGRRSFMIYSAAYVVLLAVALVVCHHLQMSAQ